MLLTPAAAFRHYGQVKIEHLSDPDALVPGAEWVQAWDALVERSPGLDTFCSSSRWVLPAFGAFAPEGKVLHGLGPDGAALLLAREHPSYEIIVHPLEAMWGFASGVAGPDLATATVALARAMLDRGGFGLLLLPGLPIDRPFARTVLEGVSDRAQCLVGPTTGRARASLAGGREGYLARRGPGLRRALKRAQKRSEGASESEGISFVTPEAQTPWSEIYQRIQAVEARSWKGQMRMGIGEDPMRLFYDAMGERLLPEGRMRVLFARRGEEDLAYHFGAVHDGVYRGLQHTYVDEARQEGLGNLTHLAMIERIADEGIETYDLGQEIDYKLRWAEGRLLTRTFYLLPTR